MYTKLGEEFVCDGSMVAKLCKDLNKSIKDHDGGDVNDGKYFGENAFGVSPFDLYCPAGVETNALNVLFTVDDLCTTNRGTDRR